MRNMYVTRMTTFIKTKFNISDDQRNIDKCRLAANITEYHIISKSYQRHLDSEGLTTLHKIANEGFMSFSTTTTKIAMF